MCGPPVDRAVPAIRSAAGAGRPSPSGACASAVGDRGDRLDLDQQIRSEQTGHLDE